MTKKQSFQQDFENHVIEGLSSFPKFLSSKYIYDEKGDALFQQIMNLPEYYLTNAEYNIIDRFKKELATLFTHKLGFDLIELGAGDGKKTKVFLEELVEQQQKFTYIPIDISQNAIDKLAASLLEKWPTIDIKGEQGTYFQVLERLSQYNKRPKLIMVLGSNIGNLTHVEAIDFLGKLRNSMSPQDLLFMGFDQKKDPLRIQNAYADSQGVTQEFNRNLLHRINAEMDANFLVEDFEHWEAYDPETGTAKSYLLATKPCNVRVGKLGIDVSFKKWETIHTEISQKYDDDVVTWLAGKADLQIKRIFEDEQQLYKNYLFNRD